MNRFEALVQKGRQLSQKTRDQAGYTIWDIVGMIHFEKGLSDEGRDFFREVIVRNLKNGTRMNLSELTPVLKRYRFGEEHAKGLDVFENIGNGGFLVVGNHARGLLSGVGNIINLNYLTRKQTEKEVIWIQGTKNPITGSLHRAVANSLDTIFVQDGNVGNKMEERIKRGEAVGIFPEGRIDHQVTKPNPKAGSLILRPFRNGDPIICAASWLDGRTHHASFQLLDEELIAIEANIAKQRAIERARSYDPAFYKEPVGCAVANLALFHTALLMPEEIRGYYKNGQNTPYVYQKEKASQTFLAFSTFKVLDT